MSGIQLRPYVDADNEQVLDVARTLAIPARVRLGIDRSPDFSALGRALGVPHEALVAEADGEIVGFIEFSFVQMRVFGRQTLAGHVSLGGVRPAWRRRGLITSLLAAALERGRQRGADWGWALVNANNRVVHRSLFASFPEASLLGRLHVHGLLGAWRPLRPRPAYALAPICDETWPELLAFLQTQTRSAEIAQLVPDATWRALPGAAPSDFSVARDASGAIVAALGSWDVSPLKRPVILDYAPLERRVLGPANRLLSGLGIAPFPHPGGALAVRYALCPLAAPGHEPALGLLLARLRRESRGVNAVLVAFPEGDPRDALVRRYVRFTNVERPFVVPFNPQLAALLARTPRRFHLEYAFL